MVSPHSSMLAGAQLGATVASILLSRIGEVAVTNLLRMSFQLTGVPSPLNTLSLVTAFTLMIALHVLPGKIAPKNIALAGLERTAMWFGPTLNLIYVRAARPVIVFYTASANVVLRRLGVEPKDELNITVSTAELSELITEAASEDLLCWISKSTSN